MPRSAVGYMVVPRGWSERLSSGSLPELRRLLQRADSALIDATGDPALAADAALQAIGRLGRRSVAVYSDVAHEELERFVRAQGACFVLGPLDERLWAEFFERFLGRSRSAASIVDTATPQLPVALWLDRATRLQQWFAQRFGENSDRSIGGHD